ncbi:MAG: hypothetical protein MUC36_01860 [Planctomycetes bacterium]|jgi:hypothetical protein|nr:hypothetical protein [Planctomycetota bacterium]
MLVRLLSMVLGASVSLSAQCELRWQPSTGYPGTDAQVLASTMWDPDGSGPAPAVPVLAGEFAICGNTFANGVAVQSPAGDAWLPLGTGITGSVRALLPLPDGELIAAGVFTQAGGSPVANVAKWSGGQWLPLGAGVGGVVNSVARLPTGDLVVGGDFATAGGAPARNLARWDGFAWHPFGAGTDAPVMAMAVGLDGALYVGGPFWSVDGVPAAHIASWRNGVWTEIGGGVPAYGVSSMCIMPGGDLVIGHNNLVARWNGLFWSDLHVPMGNAVRAVRPGLAGEIWCGTGPAFAQLLRWQAGTWTGCVRVLLPLANPSIATVLPLPGGDVMAGGNFTARAPYGPQTPWGPVARIGALHRVLRWDGQAAHSLGAGFDSQVRGLAQGLGADILACGSFEAAGDDELRGVARWAAGVWQWAGATPGVVFWPALEGAHSIAPVANGGVVVAGRFFASSGSGYTVHQAALITPSSTTRHIPSFASTVFTDLAGRAVIRLDDGQLVVGADAGIYSVSPQGIFAWISGQGCKDLCSTESGDLLIARHDTVGFGIGSAWTQIGPSFSNGGYGSHLYCVRSTRHGPVVGGMFDAVGTTAAHGIARWDGGAWRSLGSGVDGWVNTLVELPNGDLLVGGEFSTAGGVPAANLARWNGSTWSPIAGGGTNGPVDALLLAGDGTVWVGGDFTRAGAEACGYIARLATPCMATAVSFGTGCTGSGGVGRLQATSLPWLGSDFRSRADGLPSLGLAVVVNGLSTWTLPLSSVLPIGLPGCELRATPDVLDIALAVGGTAMLRLPLPSSTVWTGQQLFQQVVSLELDAFGNLAAATSTDALSLMVGGM